MRGILKKLAAAMRAANAVLTRLVMVPIRAAGGAVDFVWRVIAERNNVAIPETPWERVEADMTDDAEAGHPDLDAASTAMSLLGAEARLAAREMIAFGAVRSERVRPVIKNWIEGLTRHDLEAFVDASDLKVGRHYAGVEPMTNKLGEPIVRPRPEHDEAAAKKRAERRREFEEATKPTAPKKPEPVGGAAAPLLGLAA